jgi:hypothetical protein
MLILVQLIPHLRQMVPHLGGCQRQQQRLPENPLDRLRQPHLWTRWFAILGQINPFLASSASHIFAT